MSKLTDLRKGFASGMERGYISSDDWRDEVLPMLEDAERFDWLERNHMRPHPKAGLELFYRFCHVRTEDLRSAIDAARNTTNEG